MKKMIGVTKLIMAMLLLVLMTVNPLIEIVYAAGEEQISVAEEGITEEIPGLEYAENQEPWNTLEVDSNYAEEDPVDEPVSGDDTTYNSISEPSDDGMTSAVEEAEEGVSSREPEDSINWEGDDFSGEADSSSGLQELEEDISDTDTSKAYVSEDSTVSGTPEENLLRENLEPEPGQTFDADDVMDGLAIDNTDTEESLDMVPIEDISEEALNDAALSEIVDSGTIGDKITWSLDADGVLTITGEGTIPDYLIDMDPHAPWLYSNAVRVIVGEGITRIGNYAFYSMGQLSEAVLPESLEEIGWGAFEECQALSGVNIPSGVKLIDGIAFYNTAWIRQRQNENPFVVVNGILIDGSAAGGDTVTLPSDVKTVGPASFHANQEFNSVVIPEGVETICGGAFEGNGALTSVSIPRSVEVIGENAFDKRMVTEVQFGGTPSAWSALNITQDNNSALYNAEVHCTTIQITNASVTGISDKTYTGKAITPKPVVKTEAATLQADTDYVVGYKNNLNAGTATITITGKGDYRGTKTATFKINKAGQTLNVKASAKTVVSGKTLTISISGNKGTKSYKSSNTAVASVNAAGKVTAKKVGTVKITATAAETANYKAASQVVTIKVVPAATTSFSAANQADGIRLAWKKVAGANGYVIYRDGTKIATVGKGTTVAYTDKKATVNGKKYTYKIVAKASTGNSPLSKSVFLYRISKPGIRSGMNTSYRQMTVRWKKISNVTGYQIQYSLSSGFKSGNKSVAIAQSSTGTKVIDGLKQGKSYYVRLRAYRNVSGKRYYSAWSSVKRIAISASTIPVRQTDTTSAASGNKLINVRGIFYKTSTSKVLKRINAIRYEACKQGVINPSTGKKLKLSDYHPLKWSSDLEWIAQTRAAEASIHMGHDRPNGQWCFDCTSNGEQSWAEVLAWNFNGMMKGIEQWYEEKRDWVMKTGGVTGHYTAMIDPSYNYVALGCFRTSPKEWYCVSGEFSFATSMDTSSDGVSGAYEQRIEVLKSGSSAYSKYSKTVLSIEGASVTGITTKKYTGKAITQKPVVKIGSSKLVAGTDYTLSYKNNKKVGTATVIIKGKGKYKGTIKKKFSIKKK